ncbi:hypothetical protein [Actinoplanes sp. NPDC026623]|uniref:hypothetical protein n=1 Tax=Actinoplanes sp. NPDC026623 TaxID=3155610 RepID=UPI0033DDB602
MTSALSAIRDLIMEVLPAQSARMSVAEIVVAVKDRAGVRLGSKATVAALEELSAASMAAYQQDGPREPRRWFRNTGPGRS